MATNSLESNFVSMRPAVEFIDILDQYSHHEDLSCNFKFNDYTPQEGDRIALFKLGWSFVKDYIVFEWAPVGSKEKLHTITFNKHILPKNNFEIYQICYISGENELHGASSPFQFAIENSKSLKMFAEMNMVHIAPENASIKLEASPSDKITEIGELEQLREENMLLKESLKAVIAQRDGENTNNNYDQQIKELQEITNSLKTGFNLQQKEINILKIKIREGGEEYKKLYLEKMKLEKKISKGKSRKDESETVSGNVSFNIEGLKSIPPFPSLSKR